MLIHDALAVFFDELPALEGQEVEHGFGRAAESNPGWRYDDGPVDEDRVGHHRVDDDIVAQARIV